MKQLLVFVMLCFAGLVKAQETSTVYLSGTGATDTKEWEFYCSAGSNSKKWTKIKVPSCWEQEGFGAYNYGHDKFEKRLNETGLYRYQFAVAKSWKGKQVEIVFDGVMTDALVKINGKQAGAVHQGAFYQFRYDITSLLNYGKDNMLEVLVKKHSDNKSVSLAERKSDFWIFGGIFRPVYLECKPKANIDRVAIDAKANGLFNADVYLSSLKKGDYEVIVDIVNASGSVVSSFEGEVLDQVVRISGNTDNPKLWNAEDPNLYSAIFRLKKDDKVVHQYVEKFGFRTIEFRESDGIYVNGVRVKLKGVNRHTFHPSYARTSSKALSINAVNLMKDMNMNAVRMSHYPPDKHFLDVCDSLGMYVLDELTAWQRPSYDDVVGRKLLKEMIDHDVNHPSIIAWDNGNEGGENNNLNDDFAKFDIQKREVLHPWQDFRKTNTCHYIRYNYLSMDGFSKRKIFFPTEFLHGLYDGGHGAGLEDYWTRMWNDPLTAGGFLWVFADEAIERRDRNNELDTDGGHAPDGILGPYMEKEGSYYTIRNLWSPVFFEKRYITNDFNGEFRIQNRYFFTNLNEVQFKCKWLAYDGPDNRVTSHVVSKQNVQVDLAPGQNGVLKVDLFNGWQKADVLELEATDRHGRVITTWTWPVKVPELMVEKYIDSSKTDQLSVVERSNEVYVSVGSLKYTFSKENGLLLSVEKDGKLIPLANGPVFVSKEKELLGVKVIKEENKVMIQTRQKGSRADDVFTWEVDGSGLLKLDVAYCPKEGWKNGSAFAGITFDLPEENVAGMRWMGNGPFRVWKNRMKGTHFGVWEKAYNDTQTGFSQYIYPEFKGYHSEVNWVKVQGKGMPDFKVYVHSNDIFLRMLTPKFPGNSKGAKADFPTGDFSFLHGITPIGTKFCDAEHTGPMASPYVMEAKKIHGYKLRIKLTFDFN
ncbi:beta-galactosidase [Puteibacter caeruleilacunae]|nr:beta-galactosidase [Puteibacter caeruleilacunae]